MIDFKFHGFTALQKQVFVEKFISIPTGKERYTECVVPGRDGCLTYKEGTYEDITISVQLMYLEKPYNVRAKYRELKKWLMQGRGPLTFSDQGDFHYIVKRVEIESNEVEFSILGRFIVNFICRPHQYANEGDTPVRLESEIYNPYDEAHPLYLIQGEGMCTIGANGNTMTANVGQNLTIDTDLMLAYRTDGGVMNALVNGEYKNLYLKHGFNTLSVTKGFSVLITPRWRCL